jgi:prepilin-type N-terminal cleavage/methylation domain-containing protein
MAGERMRNESGFTLVELMIVLVLMGIIGGVVTTALVQGMRTSTQAQSRITALSDLQRGLERVARELRVADPLCLTSGEEATRLGASVYRDGKRFRHEFYLSGTGADQVLLQDITEFDPPTASTGTLLSSGLFVADIGNDLLGIPLFEYFDQNGSAPLTPGAAAQVRINLAKQAVGVDPIMISTSVEVRNTRYTGGGGTC